MNQYTINRTIYLIKTQGKEHRFISLERAKEFATRKNADTIEYVHEAIAWK